MFESLIGPIFAFIELALLIPAVVFAGLAVLGVVAVIKCKTVPDQRQ
jgi:hypothetical protein